VASPSATACHGLRHGGGGLGDGPRVAREAARRLGDLPRAHVVRVAARHPWTDGDGVGKNPMGLYPKCGESDGGDMSHSEIFF